MLAASFGIICFWWGWESYFFWDMYLWEFVWECIHVCEESVCVVCGSLCESVSVRECMRVSICMCVRVCVWVSICMCLCVWVRVCVSEHLYVLESVCESVSVYASEWVCMWESVFWVSICMCESVCEWASVCVWASVSVCESVCEWVCASVHLCVWVWVSICVKEFVCESVCERVCMYVCKREKDTLFVYRICYPLLHASRCVCNPPHPYLTPTHTPAYFIMVLSMPSCSHFDLFWTETIDLASDSSKTRPVGIFWYCFSKVLLILHWNTLGFALAHFWSCYRNCG